MAIEYKSKKVDLTTTNNTTIYTCPAETKAIIKSILISDDSGSGDTATLTITAGSSVFRLKKEVVSGDATDEVLTHPLVMEATEILKAQAVTADRLHVIVSLMEVTSDTNNPL